MKEIKMDFETYEQELKIKRRIGHGEGIELCQEIMTCFIKGESFEKVSSDYELFDNKELENFTRILYFEIGKEE